MSSKLLPRDSTPEVRAFQFRDLSRAQSEPNLDGAAKPSSNDVAERERDQLQARVNELEAELANQVPAARAAGFREGELAGRTHAEAVVKPVVERACRGIQDLIEMKPRIRKELEDEAVQLSLAIAKRVLRRELSMDAAALQGLVQVAFERLGRQEITRVMVHPEHVAPIRACLAQLTTRQIEIVGDGSRERGALIFETTRGMLDASVDTQLKEIELGLADRLKWR